MAAMAAAAVATRDFPATGPSRLTPLLLAISSAVAAVVVARHGSRLDLRSRRPWRTLTAVAALLVAAQLIYVVDPADGQAQSPWAHLPQLAAVPLAVVTCLLLLPSRSGSCAGVRDVLDGAVVLVAVVLVGALVLSDTAAHGRSPVDALMVVGYPVSGALLCGVAVMAVLRVPRSRRRAAVWLLVTMAALVVVAVAGALANVMGDGVSELVTIDVTERRTAQRERERMAYTDFLTGLSNRARFVAALEEARTRAVAQEVVEMDAVVHGVGRGG
jgi:predicted signal transduction protein with EAL and GGDEF domain